MIVFLHAHIYLVVHASCICLWHCDMQAVQASTALSSGLFPPIANKFKSRDSSIRNNKDIQREFSLPGIKINQMNHNNSVQSSSSSSLKKYKKIKYLGKGSYGAALLVCLR